MNPLLKKGIVSGIAGIALVSGGIDVGSYSGSKLQAQTIKVATEDVMVQQINNTIETIMPWKGEKGLTIKYDLGTPSLLEKFKDQRVKNVIAEKINNNDFKVDILLTEKPSTNTFCYTIEGYEDYDFFYQPPLTPQEIANGNYRAPEIVGSFAVYHKSKKDNQYQTGKVMHIPYPYVWEVGNESNKTRAEDFTFSNGQLCVVVPQTFLDSADYTNGVRIDPTFGYTSAGASFQSIVNEVRGSIFTSSESGTVSKLTAYIQNTGADAGVVGGIYNTSYSLITNGGTSVTTIPSGTTAWRDFTHSSSPSISATDYWLLLNGTANLGSMRLYYDTGSTNQGLDNGSSYTGTMPASITSPTLDNSKYSIYATYTATPVSSNISTPVSIKGNGKVEVKSGVINIK